MGWETYETWLTAMLWLYSVAVLGALIVLGALAFVAWRTRAVAWRADVDLAKVRQRFYEALEDERRWAEQERRRRAPRVLVQHLVRIDRRIVGQFPLGSYSLLDQGRRSRMAWSVFDAMRVADFNPDDVVGEEAIRTVVLDRADGFLNEWVKELGVVEVTNIWDVTSGGLRDLERIPGFQGFIEVTPEATEAQMRRLFKEGR